MTKRQLALLLRLETWFDAHPHASALDAAREMRMPPEAAHSMVNIGVSAGRLVLVGSEVYTIIAFEALLRKLSEAFGEAPFQPREMREALGEGRIWVDHLADLLGRKGLMSREQGGWRLHKGQ